jgi:hypothetical protein
MTDDQIRLDLPTLTTGRPFSLVAAEAALVFGCLRDELDAAREVMRELLTRSAILASPAPPSWHGHDALRQ